MTFDLILSRTSLEWVMIVVGVGVMACSAYVLRSKRFRRPADEGAARLAAALPALGTVSEPTRLLVATGGLLVGYHLVVWSFPATVTPIQAPREYWWVHVPVVLLVIAASILIDRKEQGEPRA